MAIDFVAASSEGLVDNTNNAFTGTMTFAAFVTPANSAVTEVYGGVHNNTNATDFIIMMQSGAGFYQYQHRAGGVATNIVSTSAYSVGTRAHVVATARSDSDHRIFVNGVQEANDVTTLTNPTGLNSTCLGFNNTNTPDTYTDASLAESAIWNVGLSDAEIAALASGVSPLLVRPQSLTMYTDGVGTLTNKKGVIAWTVSGTPTIVDHPSIYQPAQNMLSIVPSVVGGATITGQPAVVRPSGIGNTITGSGFGTTFATATLVMNGTTSVSATITGVTDTTVTFSMPADPASLFNSTGFTFTFTADDASSDTSAVVPYEPPTTHSFTTLTSNPPANDTAFTYLYSGTAPVSTDQVVYETPTPEDSLAIVVAVDGTYTLGAPLTQNNTSDYYVIQANGTVGTGDTNTFLYSAPSSGGFTKNTLKTPLSSILKDVLLN